MTAHERAAHERRTAWRLVLPAMLWTLAFFVVPFACMVAMSLRIGPAGVSWLGGLYAALLYGFIFLPVAVLVLFSFQGGRFPVPPFNGPSLKWYEAVLAGVREDPRGASESRPADAGGGQ